MTTRGWVPGASSRELPGRCELGQQVSDRAEVDLVRRLAGDGRVWHLGILGQRTEKLNDPADAAVAYMILGNVRAHSCVTPTRANAAFPGNLGVDVFIQ